MRRTHVSLALTLMIVSCSLASQDGSTSYEPSPISGERSRISGQAWAAPTCTFADPSCQSPIFPLHALISIVGTRSYRVESNASTGNFSIDVSPGEYQISAESLDDDVACTDTLQVSAAPGYLVQVQVVCVGPY
jgi:hypothetical protein